jgi:hypothetical protein
MASDWATAKANEVLSAFSWASKVGDDPLRVIAQALREARAEGMMDAAGIARPYGREAMYAILKAAHAGEEQANGNS